MLAPSTGPRRKATVSAAAEEEDLGRPCRLAGTPARLRQCLREALPREYCPAG